jgi:hypothetical protein
MRVTTTALLAAAALVLAIPTAGAKPSTDLCRQHFTPIVPGEKVLDCKYVGGDRPTKELNGQQHLTDVGTCWDFDLTAVQRCGCRLFMKSSICCRNGSTTQCEWRVGDSKLVDCKPYGQPPFGLSGTTEPEECRIRRNASDCFKDKNLSFAGITLGPCPVGPRFICPKGDDTLSEFLENRCGPTPEDCGCTLAENCSKSEEIACYKAWKADPEAVKCFDAVANPSGWARSECYRKLLESRGGK